MSKSFGEDVCFYPTTLVAAPRQGTMVTKEPISGDVRNPICSRSISRGILLNCFVYIKYPVKRIVVFFKNNIDQVKNLSTSFLLNLMALAKDVA